MKAKYQNGFFFFGIIVLIIMLTQLDFKEVWQGLKNAGYWFWAVILLWGVLYIGNTLSWYIIINAGNNRYNTNNRISFWWLYKITISGFALNYATPVGLMGGEPYRMMVLAPKIGTERASSSVILYVMTHIFSHFWFWALSIPLFILTQNTTFSLTLFLAACGLFCFLGLWFFITGYRKGIAVRMLSTFKYIPFIRNKIQNFISKNQEKLQDIDRQISYLNSQNKTTLILATIIEILVRIASGLEVFFILRVLMPEVNFLYCILIISFTTLFANLLFFMPLQLGGREGGFLMSITSFGITSSASIFVALIVRIRELIWTGIGMLLIKIEKKN